MVELLLGHLCGDYLLQTNWMAMNKTKNTLNGWLACLIHYIIYTASICLFMWKFDLIWIIVVFLSHFPIDKFSLGEKYLHYVKGYGIKNYLTKNNYNDFLNYAPKFKPEITRSDIIEGSFVTIIYVVVDNTMHIMLMWFAYKLIY